MQQVCRQLISATLLACCAIGTYAQEIKVGSVIQLMNQTVGGGGDRYLEVHGNASSVAGFKTEFFANARFVFANSSKNLDNVAGSWRVINSAKRDGEAVAYGDIIQLQSLTPGNVYLMDVNHVMREEFDEAFKAKGRGPMDAFFVYAQQVQQLFASEWFVASGGADTMSLIQKGAKVKAGDAIMLEALIQRGQGGRVSGRGKFGGLWRKPGLHLVGADGCEGSRPIRLSHSHPRRRPAARVG